MPLRVGAKYEKEQETPNKQWAEALHIQGHRSAAWDESILLGLRLLVALEIHRGALVNRESCTPERNLGGQIGGSRRPKNARGFLTRTSTYVAGASAQVKNRPK